MKRKDVAIVFFISMALLVVPMLNVDIIQSSDLWLECDLDSNYFDDYGPVYIIGSNPTLEFRGSEYIEEIHIQMFSNTYGGGFFASATPAGGLPCQDGYAEVDLKDIIQTIDASTGEPFIEAQHQIGYYGITISGNRFPSSGWKYLVKIKGSSYAWDTNMAPIKVDVTKPNIHDIDINGGIFSKVVTVTATDQESGMRNLNVLINGEDYNNGQIYGNMGGDYMTYVLTCDKKTSLTLQTVEVTAMDMAGHSAAKGHNTEPTNSPPNTPDRPTGPNSGESDVTYEYCTCAGDPDGDQVKYGFDWGDGSGTTWTSLVEPGETECETHVYSSSGDYTIKAMARDEFELESGWSSGLFVHMDSLNHPPETPSRPTGPSSGREGPTYEYCTCADDPDGDQVKYGFDWGDGSGISWTGYVDSSEDACKSHQYSSGGDFTIKAMTKDEKGLESDWSSGKSVHMEENRPPDPPNAPSGPSSGDVGIEYEYTGGATIDRDGDTITYRFNWGDGTNSGWLSSSSIEANHVWTSKDEYGVTITAKDQYGATSKSEPLAINMNNDAPEKPAIPAGPSDGKTEKAISFSTSSNDPDGHKIKYYFTWGDGKDGWTELKDSGLQAAASHVWSDAGTYEIKLKAVDQYGEESEWSDPVSIEISKDKSIERPFINLLLQRLFQRFFAMIQFL